MLRDVSEEEDLDLEKSNEKEHRKENIIDEGIKVNPKKECVDGVAMTWLSEEGKKKSKTRWDYVMEIVEEDKNGGKNNDGRRRNESSRRFCMCVIRRLYRTFPRVNKVQGDPRFFPNFRPRSRISSPL